jgi:predicted DNA-binding protein
MKAINVLIPDEANQELIKFAKAMDLPKSYLIKKAIKEYLIELKEDTEDIVVAEEVLANSTGETISLEEFEQKYGLED